MTISFVMGDRRTKRVPWRGFGPKRPMGEEKSHGQTGPGHDSPDEDGSQPRLKDPLMTTPENDLALARMMGCAFLFGLACIVGLLILIF